jgi:hypothetical protein
VRLHDTLREHSLETLPLDLLRHAKKLGFGDKQIGTACSSTELAVRQVRWVLVGLAHTCTLVTSQQSR